MPKRVIIKNISHDIGHGLYPAKTISGDMMNVSADIFCDGHDELSAVMQIRPEARNNWKEIPMKFISNDRWVAEYIPQKTGFYNFKILAWVDHFETWRKGLEKKIKAGVDV